ncbi:DNA polymerase IV [Wansuia hejianensis]|uniref:DNA polymerase IV n=1 Tax=Wansuia hejianensis TaxID=2763667 RepID=A0A926F092_9FIRM|nr:DNA polymerase IV [Wansuia hejianensis]MBC8589609.1 DNA polymerase IV [Wansuia hejianensis]
MRDFIDSHEKERLNILHIDMDAFYASVEERDNPALKGKPVIVGGKSKHGIVTTANYEARRYGIHSAMPIFIARKRCPHGYYLQPRMKRYKEVSNEVFETLYEITKIVEPVSVDEAYLDISNIHIDSVKVASEIKRRILQKTGLTLSIGISYNKFLAKLASDWNKPNGMKIISRDMVPDILLPMSVGSVHGIGPKSAKKLNDIGIYTVKDMMALSEEFLIELFGKYGREIYDRIRGIDNREVNIHRERKSLGTETTFSKDTRDKEILKSYLHTFSIEIASGLKNKGFQARTIIVKIKYSDFSIRTKSKTITYDIDSQKEIYELGIELLEEIDLDRDIRLIGLTAANLTSADYEQLSFIE